MSCGFQNSLCQPRRIKPVCVSFQSSLILPLVMSANSKGSDQTTWVHGLTSPLLFACNTEITFRHMSGTSSHCVVWRYLRSIGSCLLFFSCRYLSSILVREFSLWMRVCWGRIFSDLFIYRWFLLPTPHILNGHKCNPSHPIFNSTVPLPHPSTHH